jgi:hypothetical protein
LLGSSKTFEIFGRKDPKNAISDGLENSNFQHFLLGANHDIAGVAKSSELKQFTSELGRSGI